MVVSFEGSFFAARESKSLLLERVRAIRQKFPDEDLLVSVDGLGDDVKKFASLSLELLLFLTRDDWSLIYLDFLSIFPFLLFVSVTTLGRQESNIVVDETDTWIDELGVAQEALPSAILHCKASHCS